MATRQRARSTPKAPAIPATAASTGANQESNRTTADVPGVVTPTLPQSEVRFVGEQLVYRTREERIAESAYLRAQSRGFAHGHEVEDWLKAEQEVDEFLAGSDSSRT